MKMATVRDLLEGKGNAVWSVSPENSVQTALEIMAVHKCGAVLVLDGSNVAGIFSERDFVRCSVELPGFSKTSKVQVAMTTPVFYVTPDQSIDQVMMLMTDKRIRHLPVMESEKLVGMISIGDVVREVISEKETTIRGLENYIIGREVSL
jgi:CBS domain-containing protein